MRERLATFLRGLGSMRPYLDVRPWYWGLGIYYKGAPGFHFEFMGVVVGPMWIGFKDSD